MSAHAVINFLQDLTHKLFLLILTDDADTNDDDTNIDTNDDATNNDTHNDANDNTMMIQMIITLYYCFNSTGTVVRSNHRHRRKRVSGFPRSLRG